MAATPPPEQPSPEDAPPPKGKLARLVPVVLAVVAGIAAGGAGGAFFVGPTLAKAIVPHVATAADSAHAAEAAQEAEREGGENGEPIAKSVYTIDNLVLNPAQSGGTRFLLMTIAFELKDAATLEEMKLRDAELRDAVLVTVGAKSVEYLSEMSTRDSLKTELRTAAGKLFPKQKSAIQRIYFPQFVIQ